MDLNSAFTGAAFLLAVASPIISSSLNIWHERKLKQIELNFLHQSEIIEEYLTSVSAAIQSPDGKNLNRYGEAYGKIYSSLPERLWHFIDTIDDQLKSSNLYSAKPAFRELSKELAKTYNLRAKI